MAHLLGLEVVAEGIETHAQEAVALESGCDLLQGHLYGAAVAADELRNVGNVASKAA
jgi:EAL domain-containing protein (putative c-di-GMP-specific phosphodiesterase class I)